MARETSATGPGRGAPAADAAGGQRRTLRQGARSDRQEELNRVRQVVRPVALLALIEKLDALAMSDELLSVVMEAVESGMQFDVLAERNVPQAPTETKPEEEAEAPPEAASASPMPVYRLQAGTVIHFSKEGKPISPPIMHLFASKLQNESCFGCELMVEEMIADAPPYFKKGDILVFSTRKKPETGDFALVKMRSSDEFVQIFFSKDDVVRLRPLNAAYAERTCRRFEIKDMFKLVGRFQEL
jgi:SOS-response transcriptional repressor LexA